MDAAIKSWSAPTAPRPHIPRMDDATPVVKALSAKVPSWRKRVLTDVPEWHWEWLLAFMKGQTVPEIARREVVSPWTVRVALTGLGARFVPRHVYDNAIPVAVRRAYSTQRTSALERGVWWEFDLESWWAIWSASGKWEQRGRGRGKYVMARAGDVGPYSPSNVRICTVQENARERGTVLRARRLARGASHA